MRRALAIALLLLPWTSVAADAAKLPRWELGAGLGILNLPDYRGAADRDLYLLPFPYITYRSRYLNVDERGIKGWLFRREDARLDLSLAGGIPVNSRGDGPRAGMHDLDPTAELGPSLELRVWKSATAARELWLHVPLRSTFAVSEAGVEHVGWVAAPFLEYALGNGGVDAGWRWEIAVGPTFADSRYHDYFYKVSPAHVSPGRPAFDPPAGYSGSRITLQTQRHWRNHWIGAFVRYDVLDGAQFEDSPLVEQKDYLAAGVAIVRVLARSRSMVAAPP